MFNNICTNYKKYPRQYHQSNISGVMCCKSALLLKLGPGVANLLWEQIARISEAHSLSVPHTDGIHDAVLQTSL
jgi:hypothetical protein